jgi:hypothetical protein
VAEAAHHAQHAAWLAALRSDGEEDEDGPAGDSGTRLARVCRAACIASHAAKCGPMTGAACAVCDAAGSELSNWSDLDEGQGQPRERRAQPGEVGREGAPAVATGRAMGHNSSPSLPNGDEAGSLGYAQPDASPSAAAAPG